MAVSDVLPAAPAPDLLPLLARGRHRSPRSGACFMEMASYLAGERWSDHPACTHPVLAALARNVNDRTTDAGRPRLAPLIPRVIGLVSDDPRLEARLALRCAVTALPLVGEDRERVMAVAVLSSQGRLAELGSPADGELASSAAAALDRSPQALAWARRFTAELAAPARRAQRRVHQRGAEHVAASAAVGIGVACLPDAQRDAALHDLLATAIADAEAWTGRCPDAGVGTAAWEDACRLTGAGHR